MENCKEDRELENRLDNLEEAHERMSPLVESTAKSVKDISDLADKIFRDLHKAPARERRVSAFSIIGGASGLIALLTAIFGGGALVERVSTLSTKQAEMQSLTSRVAVMERLLESQDARIRGTEDSIGMMHRIDIRVEGLSNKIDSMKESIQKIDGTRK